MKPLDPDAAARRALYAPSGSLRVTIEFGALCDACAEWMPKGTLALFAWAGPQARQPSRRHVEGQGWTVLTHPKCRVA